MAVAFLNKSVEVVQENQDPGADLRDHNRYPFIASIELLDLERGTNVLVGRTSDLSDGGCYVDTMSPVAEGTQFRVRISHMNLILDAVGAVVYGASGHGFGVSFVYMSPQDRKTLNLWLSDLRGEMRAVPKVDDHVDQGPQFQCSEREVLSVLVSMLLRRGVLTVSDGNRLLRELASHVQPVR